MASDTRWSVNLILRKDKINKNGECPIYYKVNIEGVKRKIPTTKKIEHSCWVGDNRRNKYIKASCHEGVELNELLKELVSDVRKELYEMDRREILITHDKVRSFIKRGKRKNSIDFYKYYKDVFLKLRQTDGVNNNKGISANTLRDYISTYNVLKEYKPNLSFGDFSHNFAQAFQSYLINKKGNKVTSTRNRHKHLKAVIRAAIVDSDLNFPIINPYDTYVIQTGTVEKEALNIRERKIIRKLKFKDNENALRVARDYFIFSCYTGLRISDIKKLTYQNICSLKKTHLSGISSYIEFNQKKTGGLVKVPLTDTPMTVINRYFVDNWNNNKETLNKTIFPQYADQHINRLLKTIAKRAGVDKHITMHVGRHTFATLLDKEGLREDDIALLMGHKKKSITQTYIHNYDPNKLCDLIYKINYGNKKSYEENYEKRKKRNKFKKNRKTLKD